MKRDRILILTDSREPSVPKVMKQLEIRGAKTTRVDIDNFFAEGTFDFWVRGKKSGWTIRLRDEEVESKEIMSVWYRRPPNPKAPKRVKSRYRSFVEKETKRALWALWMTWSDDVLWVNHPITSKILEFNKPYQLQVASEIGLKTPLTLITTDAQIAAGFLKKQGGTGAIKLFGNSTLKNESGAALSVLTNRVSVKQVHLNAAQISCCPIFLQNYIAKKIELRITVTGKRLFACAIHSQDSNKTKDDWRNYDFPNVKHEPYEIPRPLADKLRRLMKALKINFGAIDMIVTPNNEYIFIEVNPNGQWGWIEALTKMSISEGIADLLCNPVEALYVGSYF